MSRGVFLCFLVGVAFLRHDGEKHLDTIKNALEKEIEGYVELKYGGSVIKHTFVDGLSDIDMLVTLNKSELENWSPKEVLDYFSGRLRERLPNTEISVGDLAVTLKFASTGIEIQLLPAIKTQTGVRIASSDASKWSNVIKPHKFAQELTHVNQSNNSKVVPVIKFFKGINSKLPKDSQMSGYHIEALATEIFKEYPGLKTTSRMLKYFCEEAARRILKPIEETTNQSEFIDSKFGGSKSSSRQKLSKKLIRISNRMKKAENTNNSEEWVKIIEPEV